ncbi:hypothetical protein COU54_03215 [Candidatus Pacearchaeota archaeon CG10_big_fil_rev_8_21_14_0_10_31_24]|nr:MAG: hypothetical protein COU54_03215 [Candidatus Pacearchaeota archaeon CG10_big_fil_rev_8_21_14_0_10_31_24]
MHNRDRNSGKTVRPSCLANNCSFKPDNRLFKPDNLDYKPIKLSADFDGFYKFAEFFFTYNSKIFMDNLIAQGLVIDSELEMDPEKIKIRYPILGIPLELPSPLENLNSQLNTFSDRYYSFSISFRGLYREGLGHFISKNLEGLAENNNLIWQSYHRERGTGALFEKQSGLEDRSPYIHPIAKLEMCCSDGIYSFSISNGFVSGSKPLVLSDLNSLRLECKPVLNITQTAINSAIAFEARLDKEIAPIIDHEMIIHPS